MVSVLGLGCNNFGTRLGLDDSRPIVQAALDAGVTLFDTAESYGSSEEILGKLLKGRRDEVVIATKFGYPLDGRLNGDDHVRGGRGGRRYIRQAVERSLRRLETDWIDLYQLHAPDPATPIVETLEALTELVTEGKVRYIGSSNLTAWQVADADWTARSSGFRRFISAQSEYSLLARSAELELIPAIAHLGIGLLPYYPLASGLLTGRYRRGQAPSEASRVTAWGLGALLTN
jgi:aryl-alcohol dehydrogenase-like predicted oxidoreductase